MFTSLKLRIDLPVDAESGNDPISDFKQYIEKFPGLKYKILPYDEDKIKFEQRLFKHGLSNVILPEEFSEALGTPHDTRADVIYTIGKYLDRVILSNHLIVVDNYVFWNRTESYTNFILDVFKKYLPKLQKITFVLSKRHYVKDVEKVITENFLRTKNHLKINTVFDNDFHDRLWICGNRGMFVGTSLNGFGQKYCLIDYIKPEDLKEIRHVLKRKNIL